MKFAKFVMAGLVLALPGLAQAQWYAGADAGANFVEKSDIKSEGSGNDTVNATSDTGYVLQFRGGYAFRSAKLGTPRLEGELGYRSTGLKALSDVDGTSGHTTALSLMTNASYYFLPNRSWHPFVGAGIGMTRIGLDWRSTQGKLVDDTDWVFSYQGFAGVSYDVTRNWELSAQYRYFATQDPEFTASDGGKFSGEYASHALMAGVTYKFGK